MRLVAHKTFTPTPGDPISFEDTVERTLRDWHAQFRMRQVLFDPYQMAAVAQRLARERMPIEEYPQTVPNLTAATSNLFDLVSARQLVLYPDAEMRLSISRAIIVESARGWRLDKMKQNYTRSTLSSRCRWRASRLCVMATSRATILRCRGSVTTSRWICSDRSSWLSTGTSCQEAGDEDEATRRHDARGQ